MFSSAVKIDQLNDYLNLGEECVLPVKRDGDSYEVKLKEKSKKPNTLTPATLDKGSNRVLVGLSDCMSCSGCLTSAEEIILKDRGYEDIAERIKEAELAAVSIAPQTAFMFAATYNVSHTTAFRRLAYFLKQLGAKRVYDLSLGEAVALHESKSEFHNAVMASLHPASREKLQNGLTIAPEDIRYNTTEPLMPIIAGHCPGWTVYAEKTLKKEIVGKISKVASSQQIQGALIKTLTYLETAAKQTDTWFEHTNALLAGRYTGINKTLACLYAYARQMNTKFPRIYHVTTAPCYDKKIEALNSQLEFDFTNIYGIIGDHEKADNVKPVDDVISTGDLKRLMEHYNVDFRTLPEAESDQVFTNQMAFLYSKIFDQDVAISDTGCKTYIRPGANHSQSGGFAEEIMKFAAETVLRTNSTPEFVQTLNSDYKEAVLKLDGKAVMKFVIAYGFRNIQNMIKNIKKNDAECPIAYIEVMACPGGCFNGAGQIIGPPEPATNIIHAIIERFKDTSVVPTLRALEQYYEETTYICTDNREDVKTLTSTVIPTFNSKIGRSIIEINVERQAIDTKAASSLKW